MKVLCATLFSILFLSLGGCNTISGFGQDVEDTGEAIEDTAE
ncbi:MAG: entericidin A/B family lipoprotein [Oceanicaulis sp.]